MTVYEAIKKEYEECCNAFPAEPGIYDKGYLRGLRRALEIAGRSLDEQMPGPTEERLARLEEKVDRLTARTPNPYVYRDTAPRVNTCKPL